MANLSMLGMLSGQTNSPMQREDDLLAKIQDLLQQYLMLGGDTPVAKEAASLSQAIDKAQSGTSSGGDYGAAPEGSPAEEASETPAEEHQEMAGGNDVASLMGKSGGGTAPKTYADARSGAKAFLKKTKAKARK